jgi:AcrR family transcriptional regulator
VSNRVSNRDALLDAAVICLREKGYARTTARDLVAASGTNLGAIGYHFGSKERLLNQAMYRSYEEWLQQVATIATMPADVGLWKGVELAVQAMFDTIESRRYLCVAFLEAVVQAEHSEELRKQIAAGYELYRYAAASHIQSTLGRPGDPDQEAITIASMIIAQMDGLLIQWLVDPDRIPTAAEFVASLQAAQASATPSR